MKNSSRRWWLGTAAVAALIGFGLFALTIVLMTGNRPLYVDYGAECDRQGAGSHLFIQTLKDGTKEAGILTCDTRGDFRSYEPR